MDLMGVAIETRGCPETLRATSRRSEITPGRIPLRTILGDLSTQ